MNRLFDKLVVARIAIACLIVVPPAVLYQRTVDNSERADRNEQIAKALILNDGRLAQERVDRTVAACQQFNEERTALIATSEALIRIAVSSSPAPLTDRDRLLLAAFVARANHEIETVTKPKTCTVRALHLQPLEGIVRQAQRVAAHGFPTGIAPTLARPVRPAPSVTGRPRPTTVPCPKTHGRCPPKGSAPPRK